MWSEILNPEKEFENEECENRISSQDTACSQNDV